MRPIAESTLPIPLVTAYDCDFNRSILDLFWHALNGITGALFRFQRSRSPFIAFDVMQELPVHQLFSGHP